MRLRAWVAGLMFFVSFAAVTPAVLMADVGTASAAPTCVLPAPVGGVITLTGDCDTTVPLTIPNGVTLNGAGFTITAHDVTDGSFNGAVLSNATGATSMNVENLTVMGTGFTQTQPPGSCGRATLNGIWFNGAGGSISNVTVTGITEGSNCQVGRAIVANGTASQTLTITSTTVSNYNKDAMHAYGMTMNVSGSMIAPPASLKGVTGQNGLVYQDGATGTTSGSTIYGSGYGNANNANTAVLLFGATNVTLRGDTITGAGTDIGVAVASNSTGAIIDRNQIGRTAPDVQDNFGFGVEVDPGSTATVTCNTFSGWNSNFDPTGVVTSQPLCVTSTSVPDGVVGTPYSTAVSAVGGTPPYSWSLVSGSLPPGLALSSTGTISGTPTVAGSFTFTLKVTDSTGASATQALTITITAPAGYWLAAADAGAFAFGAATFHGSGAQTDHLNAPVVGMASTATGGYWLAAGDGGVFSYGTAFFGSLGGIHLNAPIVGIAATPDDGGYYLVGADGGVFAFGDAHFHGSIAGNVLNKPVVGIAITPDNGGYYLASADGAVFTFGDGRFQGSMGDTPLNKPVVGIAVDDITSGYWLVARDGGLFTFGAPFLGSAANIRLNAPVVGMAATEDDLGYRFVASDGGVFCFGSARFLGSMGGSHLNKPVVAMDSIG
jgi:hypothetical protein